MDVPDPSLRSLRVKFPRRKKSPGGEPEGSPAVLAQLAGVVQDLSSQVRALRRARPASGGKAPSSPSVELPQLTRRRRIAPAVPSSSQVELPEIVRKPREVPGSPSPAPAALPTLTRRPPAEPRQEEAVNVVVERLNEVVQTLGDRVDRLMEVRT